MSSPIEMLVDGELAYWQFRAVATQTGGTANTRFRLTPGVGNFIILDTLRIGADDLTAAIALHVRIQDEDVKEHTEFIAGTTFDNVRNFLPSQNTSDADTLTDSKLRYLVIAGDDTLEIRWTQNLVDETLTVALRAYISSTIPTIIWDAIGETVSVSTTLDKVVA